ncbi:MAG: FecR family protein [Pseudomonadota bacterium]
MFYIVVSLICFQVPIFAEEPSTEKIKTVIDEKKLKLAQLMPKVAGKRKDADIIDPWIGYVSRADGKCVIKRYTDDNQSIGLSIPAENDLLIKSGDDVDVGKGSSIDITFKDKIKLSLGPRTIFRITNEPGKFRLLTGSARLKVRGVKPGTEEKIYTPNAAVNSSGKGDFAVRYNEKIKTTSAVCFDNDIFLVGLNNSRDKRSYQRVIHEDQFMEVETSYDENKEVYRSNDPEVLSRDYKKEILESFYSDPQDVDVWEYTGVSTSFLRFSLGLEASKDSGANASYFGPLFGYNPIIYLASIFYLEPYFEMSIIPDTSTFFFRAGGTVELYMYKGLYVGGGLGIFWMGRNTSAYGRDLSANIGYTFSESLMGFVDGVRVAYHLSRSTPTDLSGFLFGIFINFVEGRDS